MRKTQVAALVAIIIVIVVSSTFAATQILNFPSVEPTNTPTVNPITTPQAEAPKKPFYVGVTYCGNSTQEAKQLIDRVHDFTNLFILQSGPLQSDKSATIAIGDYAVDHGLNLMLYYGSYRTQRAVISQLLDAAGNSWGDHFLGFYFGDEPAGKMLDAFNVELNDQKSGMQFYKTQQSIYYTEMEDLYSATWTFYPVDAKIQISENWSAEKASDTSGMNSTTISYSSNGTTMRYVVNSTYTTYYPNGTITVSKYPGEGLLVYTPDGSVIRQYFNGSTSKVADQGDINQFKPYSELWNTCPARTYDETANLFIANNKNATDWLRSKTSTKIFTSDYALYWFDYKGGYDTVFAQLGINNSAQQQIALVRGAATAQNKSWGTFITYASIANPVLPSGDEMYRYLKLSYEQGASYIAVFNYAPKGDGEGLLQDEHFAALQKFWTDVVQDPYKENKYAVETALVLPSNCGFGLRVQDDSIWGFWKADSTTKTIWSNLQDALVKYGSELDIVYNDPAYPLTGKYSTIIHAAE